MEVIRNEGPSKKWLEKGQEEYGSKNYKKAAECYNNAVSCGNTHAMYLLGELYRLGKGVKKDLKQAN